MDAARPTPLLELQRRRHLRDVRTRDVDAPLAERLKSRGLELAVIVGRAARSGGAVWDDIGRDVLVVAAGVANLLLLDLSSVDAPFAPDDRDGPPGRPFEMLADATGRLADACEKIDHLEDFVGQARLACIDLVRWAAAAFPGDEFRRLIADASRLSSTAQVAHGRPPPPCRDL